MTLPPQNITLFLSSTFRDMQAEREVLMKEAFPRLQQQCLEQGARLNVVDLRWGIPPDRSESDEVIETCLREVERCRPFFVAVLGQRYGWIPEQLGESLVGRYPWLSAFPDRSLTEYEIRHGALNFKDRNVGARFYLRDPRFLETVDTSARGKYYDGDPHSAIMLEALVDEIHKSDYPLAEYADPEALASKIVDELTVEFEGALGAAQIRRERRRIGHIEIMGDIEGTRRVQRKRLEYMRARNQVAASAVDSLFVDELGRVEAFRDFLGTEASVLVCVGSEGAGTSHLLAHAPRAFGEEARPPICVSYHVAELGEQNIIHYLHWALSERSEQDEWRGLEARPEDLLASMRSAAARRPVLLTIDGASDRLLARLEWTHTGLPAGCKLAIAAKPGVLPHPLPGSWSRFDLPPPSSEEVHLYFQSYFARYGKALSPRQLNRLVLDGNYQTFGRLAQVANELRVFGHFEELDQTIDALIDARSDLEFYRRVFDRLTADLGDESRRLVELLQAVVTVRDDGLTDKEGGALLDLPPLDWVRLRTMLGGLFEPNHPHEVVLRPDAAEAVRHCFLATDEERRAVHARLAMRYQSMKNSFDVQFDADKKIASRLYHLDQANLMSELELLLRDLHTVKVLDTTLDDYWARLPPEARERLRAIYQAKMREHLVQPDPDLTDAMVRLACFFSRQKLDSERRLALSGALVAVLFDPNGTAQSAHWKFLTWPSEAGERSELLDILRELVGRVAPWSTSKLHHVIAIFERQIEGVESAVATSKAGLKRALEQGETDSLIDLTRYLSMQAFEAGLGEGQLAALLSRALKRPEFHDVENRRARVDLLHELGWIHAYGKRFHQALNCFERMNDALDAKALPWQIAQVSAGKASVLWQLGMLAEAREFGRRALAIQLEAPPPTKGLHEFAALLASMVAESDTKDAVALELLERALEHPEMDDGDLASQLAGIRIDLGLAYWRGGEFESALKHFHAVTDSIDGADHPTLFASACSGIGCVQHSLGRYDDAVLSFDRAIERFDSTEKEAAGISGAVTWVRKACALSRLGRQQKAQRAAEAALSLIERQKQPMSERALAFEMLAKIYDTAGETVRSQEARERAQKHS